MAHCTTRKDPRFPRFLKKATGDAAGFPGPRLRGLVRTRGFHSRTPSGAEHLHDTERGGKRGDGQRPELERAGAHRGAHLPLQACQIYHGLLAEQRHGFHHHTPVETRTVRQAAQPADRLRLPRSRPGPNSVSPTHAAPNEAPTTNGTFHPAIQPNRMANSAKIAHRLTQMPARIHSDVPLSDAIRSHACAPSHSDRCFMIDQLRQHTLPV